MTIDDHGTTTPTTTGPEQPPTYEEVRRLYQQRIDESQRRLDGLEDRCLWISRFRGLTFFPAVILAVSGWMSSSHSWIWFVGAAVFFLGFLFLAAAHENLLRTGNEIRQRRQMNQTQLARSFRNWNSLDVAAVEVPPDHRANSLDLDLFGRASLYQLLCLAHTPLGHRTLRDWLLQPASPDEIRVRQQAVSTLAPQRIFREELDLRGRLLGGTKTGAEAFVHWAEGPTWLTQRVWLIGLARAVAGSVIAALACGYFRVVQPEGVLLFLLAVVALNVILVVVFAGRIHSIFSVVTSRNHDIQQYRYLFQLIADLPDDGSFSRRLQANMGKTPSEPLVLLKRLLRIVGVANLRRDALFGIPYLLSEVIFLTDFHVLHWLESWQRRHGQRVRAWLESVGQLEAISSLATLAHDQPAWALPIVEDPSRDSVQAQAVGHPLLAPDVCVRNDVQIGPPGTFLLVTGSNMSGKSTLLRAIGVNVALAQAGGPVCASQFRMPPLRLATSMRIDDSLADGVSFFMAELQRLKQIVNQSREGQNGKSAKLLYLLDEILQGTNSAERHIAASRVIGHLVRQGCLGAVSTHDLELSSREDLAAACQTVHFRETIAPDQTGRQMTFDYKMRPGLAPTTNALKLLEMVGLEFS